ncbi:MAG: hypothetical protein J4G13_01105 [Dehalococcoidia bacterium]|nr:hypothetical protein [Dehalococcoidia bacterium]
MQVGLTIIGAIAIPCGVAVLLWWSEPTFGEIWKTLVTIAVIFFLSLLGAIAGKAKDATAPSYYPGRSWLHIKVAWITATRNENFAGLFYSAIQWLALLVAGWLILTGMEAWLPKLLTVE